MMSSRDICGTSSGDGPVDGGGLDHMTCYEQSKIGLVIPKVRRAAANSAGQIDVEK